MKIGIPKEYRVPGMAAEIGQLWEQGAPAQGRGAEIVEVSPAAHEIRAGGLLDRGAGGSLLEPRALRRRAPTACAYPGRDIAECTRRRARRLWPEVRRRIMIAPMLSAAITSLLSARAKSAHADQRAISRTASQRIHAMARAGDAVAAFAWLEEGRPAIR